MRIRTWGVGLLGIAWSACSSSPPPVNNDGGGGDGGGSACSGSCPIATPTCGVYEACGQLIDCGMCAFGSSAVPYEIESGGFAASAPGGAIELAYVSQADDAVHVARFSGGAWSDEVAVPATTGTPAKPVLAIAPDGMRWLEYSLADAAFVTSAPEGGAWAASTELPGEGPLAVGSDGTPWLAYYQPGGLENVDIASPDGSAWTPTRIPVQTSSPPVLAVSGSQPVVVVVGDNVGPQLAQPSGSGWAVATIPGAPMFFDGAVLVAADTEHVAVVTDFDDAVTAYVLSGTTWTTTELPQLTQDLLPDEITIHSATYDSHGTLWLATGGTGAYLVDVTPDGAPTQRILQTAGDIQLVPDPVNGVAIVNSQPLEVLTRTGDVSPASASTCSAIVTSLCQSACTTCITGGPCSWTFATTGDNGNTYGSAVDCAFSLTATMCGDADSAGSALDACAAAAPTTACTGPTADCTDGCAILPSACDAVY